MRGGPFPLLVEVAKLVEADLDRKISVRSRIGVVEELGSSPIAPMCRNIMIGSTRPGPDLFSFFPVCRSARMERKNQVVCGHVRICTYLYLFSDQSASFFDLTRSSFSLCFQ